MTACWHVAPAGRRGSTREDPPVKWIIIILVVLAVIFLAQMVLRRR
jgi:hypothetical protein